MENHTKNCIQLLEHHWIPPQNQSQWLFLRPTIVANYGYKTNAPENITTTKFGYQQAPENYQISETVQQQVELVLPLIIASQVINVNFFEKFIPVCSKDPRCIKRWG
jgi:hypothetical protein